MYVIDGQLNADLSRSGLIDTAGVGVASEAIVPVSQARIVSEVYGSLENKPAMGWVIASQLNRPWIDDRGRRFVARLGPVYDRHAGQNNLDNHQIVSELSAGRPLVLGAGGHAVVLTRLEYQTMPPGLNVTGGTVFDPWPGRGLRPLSWNELVPGYLGGGLHFLATVQCVRV